MNSLKNRLKQVIWTSSKGRELADRKMLLAMTPMVKMRSIVNDQWCFRKHEKFAMTMNCGPWGAKHEPYYNSLHHDPDCLTNGGKPLKKDVLEVN